MNDGSRSDANLPPSWFADFEEKLVDLIRSAPGKQQRDLGACLTVLIPRGGGADDAIFGGLVTSENEPQSLMQEELLTAVIWALLADGIRPDVLRAAFEHAVITASPAGVPYDDLPDLDALLEDVVN